MTKEEEATASSKFVISVDELFPIFDEHLSGIGNIRIVFSAKFGMGKTHFLKEFFKNSQDKYETFHLFPTNYQIASNEDITGFLKGDLLVEIVNRKEGILETNDYSNLIDLQRLAYIWGKDNKSSIIRTGLSYIPKLGKPLQDTVLLAENFMAFKETMELDEEGLVNTHLKEVKEKNIQEPDEMSNLIKDKITELKGDKKSILVLDDLDRMDPEHIFRILNIFSAHFDSHADDSANKFGFDKVIVVADARNIKSIFHHRFGAEADFGGYFDKFYSFEVFQFNNEELIEKVIDDLISRLKVEDKGIYDGALGRSGFLRIIMKEILTQGINIDGKEKINLRQLFSGTKTQIPAFKRGTYRVGVVQTRDVAIIQFTNICLLALRSILGGHKDDVLSLLKKIRLNLNEPDKGKEHIYKLFSQYILMKLSPYDPNVVNLQLGWKSYSIEIKKGELVQVTDSKSNTKVSARYLLYDLLIDYVANNHYLKTVDVY